MTTVMLGEIANLQAGVGFPPRMQGRSLGDYPMAKVGDISRVGRSDENVLSTADNFVDEGDLSLLRARPVPKGSILFAKIGEAIRKNHRAIAGRPILLDNNAMAAIPIYPRVDPSYLFRFLQTVDFYALSSSTTVPSLRKGDLTQIKVPLPDIDEQRRIVAILDQADALRTKRNRALRCYETIEAARFREMFRVGQDWSSPTRRVGDAGYVQLGRQRSPKYQTGRWSRPYMRVANIQLNRIDTADTLSMDFDAIDFEAYKLAPGDILLNEGQSTELVGRPAMWRGEIEDCCFQNTLIRFRANPDVMLPEFALHVFLNYFRSGELARVSSKTSNVAHLGKERFARMIMPVPTMTSQRQFAAWMSVLIRRRSDAEAALAAHDELFASLQFRAFRGEL